jgi:hypothetical protein
MQEAVKKLNTGDSRERAAHKARGSATPVCCHPRFCRDPDLTAFVRVVGSRDAAGVGAEKKKVCWAISKNGSSSADRAALGHLLEADWTRDMPLTRTRLVAELVSLPLCFYPRLEDSRTRGYLDQSLKGSAFASSPHSLEISALQAPDTGCPTSEIRHTDQSKYRDVGHVAKFSYRDNAKNCGLFLIEADVKSDVICWEEFARKGARERVVHRRMIWGLRLFRMPPSKVQTT